MNCNETADRLFTQFSALADVDARGTAARIQKKMDLRNYGLGAQILRDLGVGKMRLLARQRKMPSMTGYALKVSGYEEGSPS